MARIKRVRPAVRTLRVYMQAGQGGPHRATCPHLATAVAAEAEAAVPAHTHVKVRCREGGGWEEAEGGGNVCVEVCGGGDGGRWRVASHRLAAAGISMALFSGCLPWAVCCVRPVCRVPCVVCLCTAQPKARGAQTSRECHPRPVARHLQCVLRLMRPKPSPHRAHPASSVHLRRSHSIFHIDCILIAY